MHYVDEGSGPPILFVHGTPTNSYEYRHLIAALANAFAASRPITSASAIGSPAGLRLYARSPRRACCASSSSVSTSIDFTLVVHDFGGPIGLPLVVGSAEFAVAKRVDHHEHLGVAARRRSENGARRDVHRRRDRPLPVSLCECVAAADHAVGLRRREADERDSRALPRRVPRSRRARAVLHALAKSLLGSRAHYQSLLDRIECAARACRC